MNPTTRTSGVFSAAAALGVGACLLTNLGAPRDADPALPAPLPVATAAFAPAPAPANAQPAAATAVDHTHDLALPDGTFVPALNGATDPAPLQQFWGPFAWSPIVGVRQGAGIDWYEHADGSMSTTQMVWCQQLGRELAMTRVAHPGPAPAEAAPAPSGKERRP